MVTWAGTPPLPNQIKGSEGVKISVIDVATNICVICEVLVKVDTIMEINQLFSSYGNATLRAAITATHPGIKASVKFIRKDRIGNSNNTDQPFGGIRVKTIYNTDGLGNVTNKKKYLYAKWDEKQHSSGRMLFQGVPETNYVTVTPTTIQRPIIGDYNCAYYTVNSSGTAALYLNDYNTICYTDVIELFENDSTVGGIEHRLM